MKNFAQAILILLAFSSCRYLPMVKYFSQKKETSFPKFSKHEKFKGSVNSLRAYDITTYDWSVKVLPKSKRLESSMKIDFTMQADQDTILLDLQKVLNVKTIVADVPVRWKHSRDLLYVVFSEELPKGTKSTITIKYDGKPTNLSKEGPIQWKEDKNGTPWISTQTEGVGAHFMMPCKELLYDEPEKCIIRVEVPEDLLAVANGKLDSTTAKNGFKTYHWSVQNPINIYNVSFNVGDFVKIEKVYTDIEDTDRIIEIYALRQDEEKADAFYDQTVLHLQELEKMYGVFPWWSDGCKIVQSTLGRSAMEHQSAISMGSILTNDFQPRQDSLHINTTLTHELAHEWWGNLVTGYDYGDMWLHEGFATYSEALVIERLYKPAYYDFYIRRMAYYVENARPVLKPTGVRYNSWVSHKDGDIYNKGGLLLHTVRRQLNDDKLFFEVLKSALSEFERQNITTDQFIQFFSAKAGKDLSGLFNLYLKYDVPPILDFQYDSLQSELQYKWATPLKEEFPFTVIASTAEEQLRLTPTDQWQTQKVGSRPKFDIANFGYVLVSTKKEKK